MKSSVNTMVRFMICGIASTVLMAGGLKSASADSSTATASANASATIVTPITISKTGDLSFGSIAAGTGGTVIIAPAGTASVTGDVVLVAGAARTAASFLVGGESGSAYTVTLPADGVVTLTSGTDSMDVDTFTKTGSHTYSLTAGSDTFSVGATLTVGSAQAAGNYTGTFDVTVTYD